MSRPLFAVTRMLLLGSGLLLLGACATGPTPVPAETREASQVSPEVPTPALPAPRPGVAPVISPVDGLLLEAQEFRKAGNLPASFARLDRALRIAPQRAEVYLELARSHLAAGNPQRASASAERGLLYCSSSICGALRRFIDG
ncbi:MAG: hypothetical protein NWP69_14595 [Congregibacter sp.]|nr:hypothetical protein [Congregibacter sp.]MDP5071770.1 hypothetical protein [Congregibacter sp.]